MIKRPVRQELVFGLPCIVDVDGDPIGHPDIIAALNASREWVPVADRLPTVAFDELYLVTVDDDSVDEPTVFASHWDGERFVTPDSYRAEIGTVIAWQKLPEPYHQPQD